MNDLRETPRIDMQHMVGIGQDDDRPDESTTMAMILNVSQDGALIETREPLDWTSLVLFNTYKNENLVLRAVVIHSMEITKDDCVYGIYRTGIHFTESPEKARDFLISLVKRQDKAEPVADEGEALPDEWMDTGEINSALFSADSFDEEDGEPDALDDLNLQESKSQTVFHPPEPTQTSPFGKPAQSGKAASTVKTGKAPSKPRSRARWFYLLPVLAAVFFVALLVMFRAPAGKDTGRGTFLDWLGLEIPFLDTQPKIPGPDSMRNGKSDPSRVVLIMDSISGSWIQNPRLGPLYVIRGFLSARPDQPLESVQVRGNLFNAAKKRVRTLTVWPGADISDQRIAGFDRHDLDRMKNLFTVKAKTEKIPFLLIFSDVPEDIDSFSVDLDFPGK